MEFDKYKGIIQMVLSSHLENPEAVTAELLMSLKVADSIFAANGTAPVIQTRQPLQAPAQSSGLIIPAKSIPEAPPQKRPGAQIISFAPPVAGADEEEVAEDIDYWESAPGKGDGCQRLQSALQKILPKKITVQVPSMPNPLELVLGIGSPGQIFVHVNYSIPGGELGPRYTLMTSIHPERLDKDVILNDILEQATSMYSAERRVVQPNTPPPQPPPSGSDLARMMQADRAAQQPVTQEDAQLAREWSQNRSPRWQ